MVELLDDSWKSPDRAGTRDGSWRNRCDFCFSEMSCVPASIKVPYSVEEEMMGMVVIFLVEDVDLRASTYERRVLVCVGHWTRVLLVAD